MMAYGHGIVEAPFGDFKHVGPVWVWELEFHAQELEQGLNLKLPVN